MQTGSSLTFLLCNISILRLLHDINALFSASTYIIELHCRLIKTTILIISFVLQIADSWLFYVPRGKNKKKMSRNNSYSVVEDDISGCSSWLEQKPTGPHHQSPSLIRYQLSCSKKKQTNIYPCAKHLNLRGRRK